MTESSEVEAAAVGFSGPFFDDLERGYLETRAPAVTLTAAHAVQHQSILGSRLRLALDAELARRVTGADGALAHPSLVCDVAIGQSTLMTQRVIANLFYNGLAFHRAPTIGDTLHTTTEVVALKQNRARGDRPPTGLAVLRILTVDQEDRPVLDFTRCAMLPLRDSGAQTGHADSVSAPPPPFDVSSLARPIADWRLDRLPATRRFDDFEPGTVWEVQGGDVVSSAPELARLTLNIATAHHDTEAGQRGERLVYGGHTIGVAAGQLTRALPDLATIVAWHGCSHLAPVFEQDTLRSTVELEDKQPLERGGLLHLRSRVSATHAGQAPVDVLDWRLVAAHA